MTPEALIDGLILAALGTAGLLLLLLGVVSVRRHPLREPLVGLLVRLATAFVFVCMASALAIHFAWSEGQRTVSSGEWFSFPGGEFSFDFLIDSMSLAFAALSAGLCGIVAEFSHRYLHRDPGFHRYFILFAAFVLGIQLVALAGSVEVLFAGWEFLGVSSALLVGFFHERRAPVDNALRVFTVYRISDAAMLSAAVLLHHSAGSGSLSMLFSTAPDEPTLLAGSTATAIAMLLIVAVAGKSALLPFSGWLPRAMEGPTPSSAVYYGALSIHAGCFLLLRAGPVLEQSAAARIAAGLIGLATALYAAAASRVQADVKSILAFGALTHVGLIVLEISLGWYTLAFLHLTGHACFRLLQFLTAPNILHDLHDLASPAEAQDGGRLLRLLPAGVQRRLYLIALERGFLDSLIDQYVVTPFLQVAGALDRLDRMLCGVISGAGDETAMREVRHDD